MALPAMALERDDLDTAGDRLIKDADDDSASTLVAAVLFLVCYNRDKASRPAWPARFLWLLCCSSCTSVVSQMGPCGRN